VKRTHSNSLACYAAAIALIFTAGPAFAQFTQQGTKLVGTPLTNGTVAEQGVSVAISGDGNTLIEGGPLDNTGGGGTWVFTRSGTTWTQQAKLVGTGGVGSIVNQGQSVALSNDGNTALVGGFGDSSFTGAAWVFTRSGSTWTQQGSKLVATGSTGLGLGTAVSLSADGKAVLGCSRAAPIRGRNRAARCSRATPPARASARPCRFRAMAIRP
jgi:hypothetical protein